jgi:hypothetical protein
LCNVRSWYASFKYYPVNLNKPHMKPTQHLGTAFKGAMLALIMSFATYSHAQTKTITLTIKDKVTQTPIYFAHATLVDLKDSLILATKVTPQDGIVNFDIKDAGKYKIVVEKDGYTPETCYGTFSNQSDNKLNFTLSMNKGKKSAKRFLPGSTK